MYTPDLHSLRCIRNSFSKGPTSLSQPGKSLAVSDFQNFADLDPDRKG